MAIRAGLPGGAMVSSIHRLSQGGSTHF